MAVPPPGDSLAGYRARVLTRMQQSAIGRRQRKGPSRQASANVLYPRPEVAADTGVLRQPAAAHETHNPEHHVPPELAHCSSGLKKRARAPVS